MIPRLQRFYGGRPQDWLEIPAWLFWVYERMQPVLHARESIHTINEMAYATGNTEKDSGRQFMQELGRLAQGPNARQQRAHRPASLEEMQRLFSGTGTAVVSE